MIVVTTSLETEIRKEGYQNTDDKYVLFDLWSFLCQYQKATSE